MIRDLYKRFGDHVAVGGISLDVPRGAFYGIVGPNGAGKSTTIKMCTTLLRPDGGAVWVDGHDVWHDVTEAKRRFGVLPDDLPLFERLTGGEFLSFLGVFRGLAPDVVAERSDALLSVLGLDDASRTLIADYSTGMRKKISLAAAVLHSPRVLFLDEPFESVDPVSARTIQDVLRTYCAGGGTVVLSSHVMDTVERLCDHVAIVALGRIVVSGTVEAVRGGRRLEDVFIDAVGGQPVTHGDLGWLGGAVAPR
ncbi:MAG: ABC transporter ATP-binding protein [Actinobacteria bacterium]|nr:ABC transporter ATP-binding protein [Actinomycetota bacterium]